MRLVSVQRVAGIGLIALLVCAPAAFAGQAATFSVQSGGATALDPAAVYSPPAGGATPVRHLQASAIGLRPGDDLDALSSGHDAGQAVYFSVDSASVGLDRGIGFGMTFLQVYDQAVKHHAAADVFVTVNADWQGAAPCGYSMLEGPASNQQSIGLLPNASWLETAGVGVGFDDLDALDFSHFDIAPVGSLDGIPDLPAFFSLAAGSPTLAALNASAADILVYTTVGGLRVLSVAETMGLAREDDIDALALSVSGPPTGPFAPVGAWFSLSRTSAARRGVSAADILFTSFNGAFSVLYPADSLSLLSSDNVDGLELQPVPEPATIIVLSLSVLGFVMRRKARG